MKKLRPQYLLAQTLKEMMQDRPFDNINVYEILKNSSISKATFYKYFYSKLDLLKYAIYEEVVVPYFYDMTRPMAPRRYDVLAELSRHRTFYTNAIETEGIHSWWSECGKKGLVDYYRPRTSLSDEKFSSVCNYVALAHPDCEYNFLIYGDTDHDELSHEFQDFMDKVLL